MLTSAYRPAVKREVLVNGYLGKRVRELREVGYNNLTRYPL